MPILQMCILRAQRDEVICKGHTVSVRAEIQSSSLAPESWQSIFFFMPISLKQNWLYCTMIHMS